MPLTIGLLVAALIIDNCKEILRRLCCSDPGLC